MENKLKNLFDFQRFAGNSRLERIISDAEGSVCELSDDDLELVAAAGEPFIPEKRSDE